MLRSRTGVTRVYAQVSVHTNVQDQYTMGGGSSRETFHFHEYDGPNTSGGRRSRGRNAAGGAKAVQASRRFAKKKGSRRSPKVSPRSPRTQHVSPRPSPRGGASAFKLKGQDYSLFGKSSDNILGVGFISKVRLLRNKRTMEFFVAKQMKKKDIIKNNALNQIATEKRMLSQFTTSQASPFIVDFVGSYQDDKSVYFVYEYLSGGELFRHLKIQGRFTDNQCKFYAAEVLCALDYLHKVKIMHRDLKPENVMISTSGHIKLIDFGFAKMMNKNGKLYTKLGTANYLAPEMLNHPDRLAREGYNTTAEWWAFGCLVFELLTGQTAFGKSSEPNQVIYKKIKSGRRNSVPGHVSTDAVDLLDRLLQQDPKDRPKTGAEVMKTAWFAAVPWEALQQRKVLPPHIPDVRHPGDRSNFEDYDDDDDDDRSSRRGNFSGMTSSKGSLSRSNTIFDGF